MSRGPILKRCLVLGAHLTKGKVSVAFSQIFINTSALGHHCVMTQCRGVKDKAQGPELACKKPNVIALTAKMEKFTSVLKPY